MRRTRRGLAALLVPAALAVAGGCGGSGDAGGSTASKAEATVSGKVTIRGKAASKGRLNFEPLGANGMPTGSHPAQVGKGGTFSVTTATGPNDVTVAGTGDPAVDSTYNKTNFEVKPGPNTLDIDLPIKP